MSKTGIIILAAGNSSRMGEPKQLMKFKNKTFLQHIVEESKEANLNPVICVTGYPVRSDIEGIIRHGCDHSL